jgi:hypothetical protein
VTTARDSTYAVAFYSEKESVPMMPWRKTAVAVGATTTTPLLQLRCRHMFSNAAHIPICFKKPSKNVKTIVFSVCHKKKWNSPRFFSSTDDRTTQQQAESTTVLNSQSGGTAVTQEQTNQIVLYEGPLAAPLLRLKLVSITTCALGLIGLPLTAVLYGASIPAVGQLAVGGTAILATTGSTVALSYCLSPYVHTLEQQIQHDRNTTSTDLMITATTRNIFARKVETTFHPQKDVVPYNGWRPFCNFIAKGVPMYIHPELLSDKRLCSLLVGGTTVNIKEEKE